MAEEKATFEEFMLDVSPENHVFVREFNDYLLGRDCTVKLERSKSGFVLSYVHKPTKRTVANYVFRKKGMIVRVYGDHVQQYEAFLETLPESMKNAAAKASVCKRLLDPTKCSSRCPMGYTFTLEGAEHKKCRYMSFMFLVNMESQPYVRAFVEKELDARTAA